MITIILNDNELTKATFNRINGYVKNYHNIIRELEYIDELTKRQNDLNAVERAYLLSCGVELNKIPPTIEEYEFVKMFLKDKTIMESEYKVPCRNYNETSESCTSYCFHISRCPVQKDGGCPLLMIGYPSRSIKEKRFFQWVNKEIPEVPNEIAKYLEEVEPPPYALSKQLLSSRKQFENAGYEYIDLIKEEKNKHKSKILKTKRRIGTRKRFEVLKRDNFSCTYCGRTIKDGIKLHIDHRKPVSKGGSDEMDNLTTSCDECNLGKSDIEL